MGKIALRFPVYLGILIVCAVFTGILTLSAPKTTFDIVNVLYVGAIASVVVAVAVVGLLRLQAGQTFDMIPKSRLLEVQAQYSRLVHENADLTETATRAQQDIERLTPLLDDTQKKLQNMERNVEAVTERLAISEEEASGLRKQLTDRKREGAWFLRRRKS